jgi:acetyl esterase/lipase
MGKLLRWLAGWISAVLGTLIVMPRINERTWPTQLILSEFSWAVTLLGAWAARRKEGRPLGLYGAALSLAPLTRVPYALEDMERMMRAGLGDDYKYRIPPQGMARLAESPLSIQATLGSRYRRKHDVTVTRDVPYLERPTRLLRLDVYRPQRPPVIGDRYPAIVVLHGGGWASGDKGGYFTAHHRYLASIGQVVFDIQYRLTGPDGIRWPEPLADVREAIRWVKAHADAYHIDPDRLALLGRSAGGHLALQAAYRAVGDHADTAVAAVIAIYAPTNLRLTHALHDGRVVALVGGTSYEVPAAYADASPVDAVHAGAPPTLLIHGYKDGLVGPVHSELVLNRLRAEGGRGVMLRVPWGQHGFDVSMAGLGAQITQYHMDRFLAWRFYGRNDE